MKENSSKIYPILGLLFPALGLVASIVTLIIFANNDERFEYYDIYAETVTADQFIGDDDDDGLGAFSNFREPRPELQELYEQVKADVRRELAGYNNLNWERFEATPVVEVDADALMMGGFNTRYEKIYLAYDNLPQNELMKKELIAHELFHALTASEASGQNFIYEGFTELMARRVYPDSGSQTYYYSVEFAKLVEAQYGTQGAIDLFMDPVKANAELDKTLGRDCFTAKLIPIIWDLNNLSATEGGFLVFMDTIVHYAANTNNADMVRPLYEDFSQSNDQDLIKAKQYFDSVLKGK